MRIVGASVGGSATYQFMTRLGFASESPIPGPDQARGRPRGGFGHHPGRRPRRNDGGDRTQARGLQDQYPRIQPSSRRTELDAAGRRRLHGTRRGDPTLRVRRRPITSIPGRGAFPIITTRFWITAAVSGMTLEPFIQLNHNAFLHSADSVRRQAATHSRLSRPISTAGSPNSRRRRPERARLTRRCRRKTEKFSSRRCAPLGRSTRTSAIGPATPSSAHRGYAKDPGGGLEGRAGQWRAYRAARHFDFAPVARLAEFPRSTTFRPRCSSRPEGWAGSARRSRGKSRSHTIWRESHRRHAERDRRDRRVRGPRRRRGRRGGQSRLVRLHAAAHHPEPDPDQCFRAR